jgi:hypothetical protein
MRTAIAWIFIIAVALYMQLIPYHRASKTPPSNSVQDIRLQVLGKYLVGVKSLLSLSATSEDRLEPFKKMLQKGKNAGMPLIMVPIIAELSGNEAAIQELKRLAAHPANDNVDRDVSLFLQLYQKGDSSLDPQQRLSIKRYGWFGRLALSQDKPENDLSRKEILSSAFRTVIVIVVFAMGSLAALLAGFILFIIAIVFCAKGKLQSRMIKPGDSSRILLESFAIYLTGFIALQAIIHWLFPSFRLGVFAIGILAVVLAILWSFFCGVVWKKYSEFIGWHLSRNRGGDYRLYRGIATYTGWCLHCRYPVPIYQNPARASHNF